MEAMATDRRVRNERATTSFQRKGPDGGVGRLAVLPGTRPSVRHGQLLLSSGLPSLDYVLGAASEAPALASDHTPVGSASVEEGRKRDGGGSCLRRGRIRPPRGGGLAVGTLLLIGMQFNLSIKEYFSLVNIIDFITFLKVEKNRLNCLKLMDIKKITDSNVYILFSTEEDVYGVYSNLLFKHFLAEGIICGHNLFVASDKEEPADILKLHVDVVALETKWNPMGLHNFFLKEQQSPSISIQNQPERNSGQIELPSPLWNTSVNEMEEETAIVSKHDSQESMRIAWRYQNIPKLEVPQTAFTKFGHYFDLTKTMAPELIQNIKWNGFFLPKEADLGPDIKACNAAPGYTRLLHSIRKIIYEQGYDGAIPQGCKDPAGNWLPRTCWTSFPYLALA
ncbi:Elongator complex protein 4 [Varanus komodoensis]|nr:Elongator complex protein 4 [Varanus komodoensis]